MPALAHRGISLYYEASGNGPPVDLTHSFLCDGTMFRQQAAVFEKKHRVVNIDMRGHGRSGAAEAPFTIYDRVDDVKAVLNAEGIESALWMGLSIGVLLFMCAELTQPWRVKALVLLDADAGPESAWKKPKYQVMKWGLKHLGRCAIPPELLPIMLGRTTLRERAELRAEYANKFLGMRVDSIQPGIDAIIPRDDLLSRLPQNRVPTLVVVG